MRCKGPPCWRAKCSEECLMDRRSSALDGSRPGGPLGTRVLVKHTPMFPEGRGLVVPERKASWVKLKVETPHFRIMGTSGWTHATHADHNA